MASIGVPRPAKPVRRRRARRVHARLLRRLQRRRCASLQRTVSRDGPTTLVLGADAPADLRTAIAPGDTLSSAGDRIEGRDVVLDLALAATWRPRAPRALLGGRDRTRRAALARDRLRSVQAIAIERPRPLRRSGDRGRGRGLPQPRRRCRAGARRTLRRLGRRTDARRRRLRCRTLRGAPRAGEGQPAATPFPGPPAMLDRLFVRTDDALFGALSRACRGGPFQRRRAARARRGSGGA